MGNEIVPSGKNNAVEAIDRNKVVHYLQTFGLANKLNQNEIGQFVEVATAFQLNPFKREIYCIPYEGNGGRKLSIITGYEVYIKRAERIGDLNGWSVTTDGSVKDNTLKAIITIHRKSWATPLVHEVYFSEYNQNNKIWREKPITMIKKVAIATGFRLAFPDHFAGMPYTSDELPDNMTKEGHIAAEPVVSVKPQRKSEVEAEIVQVDEIKAEQEAKEKAEIANKVAEAKARLEEASKANVEPEKVTMVEGRDAEGFASIPESNVVTAKGIVSAYVPKDGRKPYQFNIGGSFCSTYDDTLADTIKQKKMANLEVEVVCNKAPWSKNGKSGVNLTITEVISRD